MCNKRITVLFFVFLIMCVYMPVSYAAPFAVPGITCGDANSTSGANKCCTIEKIMQPPGGIAGGILSSLPAGVGDFFSGLFQLQRTTKPVACVVGYPQPNPSDPNCICVHCDEFVTAANSGSVGLCNDYLSGTREYASCIQCAKEGGIWTSFKCIHGDIGMFITEIFLGLGVGLGGVISLGCIILGAIQIQVSRGEPERITKAKEKITSCIIGLLIVIFSVVIMRIIGIDILRIPGFGV